MNNLMNDLNEIIDNLIYVYCIHVPGVPGKMTQSEIGALLTGDIFSGAPCRRVFDFKIAVDTRKVRK